MPQDGCLDQLMAALRCLPGVGPKTAQRMTFHLLQHDRQGARKLAETLLAAIDNIGHCRHCRTLTEQALCAICANPSRDPTQLCIVETPADVFAIDQATVFNGLFFVLHGRLSPLDGIGPEELGFELLEKRLTSGVEELILATNTTVEGEATAHFIAEMAHQHRIQTTRIAHGIPVGGELEYIDRGTLSYAFNGRKAI